VDVPGPSGPGRVRSAERGAPSAERRAPSAERRAPSAERRAPNAERGSPSAEQAGRAGRAGRAGWVPIRDRRVQERDPALRLAGARLPGERRANPPNPRRNPRLHRAEAGPAGGWPRSCRAASPWRAKRARVCRPLSDASPRGRRSSTSASRAPRPGRSPCATAAASRRRPPCTPSCATTWRRSSRRAATPTRRAPATRRSWSTSSAGTSAARSSPGVPPGSAAGVPVARAQPADATGRCGEERLVALSCKGRLCPSCWSRRAADLAADLVDRVLPVARPAVGHPEHQRERSAAAPTTRAFAYTLVDTIRPRPYPSDQEVLDACRRSS